MSLTAALNATVSGLRVNQANVQLVSANVAHANDPNYTKKTLNRETLILDNQSAGGVIISGYEQAVSVALKRQFEAQTAVDGLTSTQNEYLSRIQDLLGSSGDKAALTTLLSNFTAAWQMLQAQPESAAAQRQVIALGDQFAAEVRRLAAGADQIERDMRDQLENDTDKLNDLLAQVFELNVRIKSSSELTPERLDLMDQRDVLVRQIAELVDVRTIEREGGAIALFTPAGLSLLDGAPSRFSFDGTNLIGIESGNVVNNLLRGGEIKALLDLKADNTAQGLPPSGDPAVEVLRKLRSQLDLIVQAFTDTTGTPTTFAAAYNNASSSLRITSSVQTTVQASSNTAQFSTVFLSGSIQAGDVFEVTVNGKTFKYTATANDSSFDQIALQLTNLINADTTLGVTAINGIGSFQLVGSANNAPFSVVSSVNGQVPELSQGIFSGTNRYTFAMHKDLVEGIQQLKRNAAPDVVTALTSSDRNFAAAGLILTNVSYKGLMSGIVGVAATNAKTVLDASKLNAEQLQMTEQRYRADTGVNLDEELATLQLLQNAYAASARLMSVIQTLFDTLQAAVAR